MARSEWPIVILLPNRFAVFHARRRAAFDERDAADAITSSLRLSMA
jgi:hypothetical protein